VFVSVFVGWLGQSVTPSHIFLITFPRRLRPYISGGDSMKRINLVFTAALLLAVALAGCGGAKPPAVAEKAAATAQKAGEKAVQQAATKLAPTAEKAAPTAAKPAPAAASADAELSLQSRETGLDKLKTYRSKWQGEWSATDKGAVEKASWEWFEEVARDSQAQHWGSKMVDSQSGKPVEFEIYRIADATYIVTKDASGKQECLMMSGEAASPFSGSVLTPNTFGGVNGAKFVGAETINGIKTKHYKYDDKAASLTAFGRVSGEIWVAEDGGYVVKDAVTWEGGAGMFSGNAKSSGKGAWTFEVYDVNKPLTIEPPTGCDKGKVDVPLMPDATETARMGPVTTYKTASKLADVAAFYKTAMEKAGWQLDNEPEITEEAVALSYIKDNATVQITAMPADDKTQVLISTAQE